MASISQYVASVTPPAAPTGVRATAPAALQPVSSGLGDAAQAFDRFAAVQQEIENKKRAAFENSEVVYRTAQVSERLENLESELQQKGLRSSEYMDEYTKGFRSVLLDQRLDPELKDPVLRERVSQAAWQLGMQYFARAKKHADGLFFKEKEGALVQGLDFVRKGMAHVTNPADVDAAVAFGGKLITETYGAIAPDKVEEAKLKWRTQLWKDYAKEWAARDPSAFLADQASGQGVLTGKVDVDTEVALTRSAIERLRQQEADKKKLFTDNSDTIEKDMVLRIAGGGTVSVADLNDQKGQLTRESIERVLSVQRTYDTIRSRPTPTDAAAYWQVTEEIATGQLTDQRKLAERLRGRVTPEDYRAAVSQLVAETERRRQVAREAENDAAQAREKDIDTGKEYIKGIFEPGGQLDFLREVGQIRSMAIVEYLQKVRKDPTLNPVQYARELVRTYAAAEVEKVKEAYTGAGAAMAGRLRFVSVETLNMALKSGQITQEEWEVQRDLLDRIQRLKGIAGGKQ